MEYILLAGRWVLTSINYLIGTVLALILAYAVYRFFNLSTEGSPPPVANIIRQDGNWHLVAEVNGASYSVGRNRSRRAVEQLLSTLTEKRIAELVATGRASPFKHRVSADDKRHEAFMANGVKKR